MQVRFKVSAGVTCCVLLLGGFQPVSAHEDDEVIRPPRTGPAFEKLVDGVYQALRAHGVRYGTTRRQQIEAESLEAAGLEAKGFDDPKDEARNRALIRHAADLGDADAHAVLLSLHRFWHVPCRKRSPSGC